MDISIPKEKVIGSLQGATVQVTYGSTLLVHSLDRSHDLSAICVGFSFSLKSTDPHER